MHGRVSGVPARVGRGVRRAPEGVRGDVRVVFGRQRAFGDLCRAGVRDGPTEAAFAEGSVAHSGVASVDPEIHSLSGKRVK